MERRLFGSSAEGIPIHIFTLESASGVRVRLMEYGASIVSIEAPDRFGGVGPVTLGFESLDDYLGAHPFVGATIGRFANRIGGSYFEISGVPHPLSANEGVHHLHGGDSGLHRSVWWGEALGQGVRFHCTSPKAEEGYPGNLECSVEYRLSDRGELKIGYSAITDAPTVVNFTNHTYFNLLDGGRHAILDHEIEIASDEVLEMDACGIPTGYFVPIEGSALDFEQMRRIGERIEELTPHRGGYDHCYVVRGGAGPSKPVARVREASSGRTLSVFSSQPGVQFYSGNSLAGIPAPRRHGFCLETQHYPDSPNHVHFPDTRLEPGRRYDESVTYHFGVEA